jgi:hypothetical protein
LASADGRPVTTALRVTLSAQITSILSGKIIVVPLPNPRYDTDPILLGINYSGGLPIIELPTIVIAIFFRSALGLPASMTKIPPAGIINLLGKLNEPPVPENVI